MSDLLKRSKAPLTDEAWAEIDDTALQILRTHLSARSIVDFDGPHGWGLGAINLGRLEIPKKSSADGIPWGTRIVQPLVELRVPFKLDQLELDNISRGCRDPDFAALEEVARRVAQFEERAVYVGFQEGHITGILEASSHEPLKLDDEVEKYPDAIAEAVRALKVWGVGGPYAVVLSRDLYTDLHRYADEGYPLTSTIRGLTDGPILWSPALEGGVVLSTRGGDFEMTVGQDLSIGYASHDRNVVELFLTESFTFRVLEPAAAIQLKTGDD